MTNDQQTAPSTESNEPAEKLTIGQKFADAVTKGMGTWKFVLGQSIVMAAWITLNVTNVAPFIPQWDPNLTLLNLALSTEAAYAGSFILMSQNRQAEKDRQTALGDYKIDIEAHGHVKELNRKLDIILAAIPPEKLKALTGDKAFSPPPANANDNSKQTTKLTLSQRFADAVTKGMGSWKFIIGQAIVQTAWIVLNTTGVVPFIPQWDPGLTQLNVALSTEAALAASFILMSQHRQGEKDRATAQHDYQIDKEAHAAVQEMNRKLDIILTVIPPEELRVMLAAKEAAAPAAEAPAAAQPAKQPAAPGLK